MLVFGYFFRPYTLYTFRAEAINTFFTIKTEDKSLIQGQNKLRFSFCNKVRIIFRICPNARLRRLLDKDYKGEHKILKELDMVRIVNEIKYLKDLTRSMDPERDFCCEKKNPREINIDTDSDDQTPPFY